MSACTYLGWILPRPLGFIEGLARKEEESNNKRRRRDWVLFFFGERRSRMQYSRGIEYYVGSCIPLYGQREPATCALTFPPVVVVVIIIITAGLVVQPCSREVNRPADMFPVPSEGRRHAAPRSVAYCFGCPPTCTYVYIDNKTVQQQ